MSLDAEALLMEISPDAPCGDDISYDPAYLEMERLAQGTAEQQVGDEIVAAEDPNWKDVHARCVELLVRGRDLRVLIYLVLAELNINGVVGFRDGIALLHQTLERYWDTVHPQLDPEDDNDPLERMNIIASLSPSQDVFQDPMRFRERLSKAPLSNSRQLGIFGLRHILVVTGELPPDPEVPDKSIIDGAFEDTDIEELQTKAQALSESAERVGTIETLLSEHVGEGSAPNLEDLKNLLQQAAAHVNVYLQRRGYGSATDGDAPAGTAPVAGQDEAAGSGAIRSPGDVMRAMDRICEYYERAEPSSPVPLLIRRARRLVGKSFLDVVRDLSPDAMKQVEAVGGVQAEGDEKAAKGK